jgi:hypothetical protein
VRRYPEAVRGNVQKLDIALSSAMPVPHEEDTVKKLRLQLRRSLLGV